MKPLSNNTLKECTVLGAKIQNDIVIAKNRDRNYYPKIKIVHEIIDETEVAYMLDVDTDYSEGMNEHGIGIVNATLQGIADEKAGTKSKSKKSNVQSKDGFKIRHALGMKNASDVIESIISSVNPSTGFSI